MVRAYRIVKPKHAATAFSGDGSRLYGGRWNSVGSSLVYLSQSVSLASLEILVHVKSVPLLQTYSLFEVDIPEKFIQVLNVSPYPKWADDPVSPAIQTIGDSWCSSMSSLVLQVPSVVTPSESNYLLNTGHPDWSKLKISEEKTFSLDSRLRS